MEVTVTVERRSNGARADVRLDVGAGEPAGALLDDLRRLVGGTPGEPVAVGHQLLDPAGTVRDWELCDGQVVTVGAAPEPSRTDDPPGASGPVLMVVGGPAAGSVLPLTGARAIVGRDDDCDLSLDDAAVSRRHLAIWYEGQRGYVEDLGSRNGTAVGGQRVSSGEPASLEPEVAVRLGSSELTVRRPTPPARVVPSPDGRLVVHRSPRGPDLGVPVEIQLPEPPSPPTPTRLPVLVSVAPVVLGLLLALLLHQWQFLAFTALSPVMIGGQAISDRWASRRTHRAAMATYRRRRDAAEDRIAAARAAERVRRRAAAPDLSELVSAAVQRSATLWQRAADDVDALVLRVGCGNPPSEVTVPGRSQDAAVDVPVTVRMRELDTVGIVGPTATVTGLGRALLVQAATLHGPSQCRIVVVAPARGEEWSWVRWLPHTLPGSGQDCTALLAVDERQAAARLAEIEHADSPGTPTLLLVDATAAPGARPLSGALEAVAGRASTIWLAGRSDELPAGARTLISVGTDPTRIVTMSGTGTTASTVRPDLLSRLLAETAARAMAPLRDGSLDAATALPAVVPWAGLAGLDLSKPERAVAGLTRAWAAGPSTVVPLGLGLDGEVAVDLATDGPHALVAGTTGSGKSGLLQILVAGLAARNRPEDLALLLIDFKGGAAFGGCERLPHTVGVLTDLDPGSTTRALVSLDAELRRRERVLADAGAVDLDGYVVAAQRSGATATAPPRLVIVVDEFATLVDELPDFVTGLVGIAQRGRSLGVNLVLATQRPEGIVSADIRANTGLRICLAVTRPADSRDVIDGPQAAAIGPGRPGRGYLRAGPGPLTLLQTGQLSGCAAGSRGPRIRLSPSSGLGEPPAPTDPPDRADTDRERLIDAAVETARRLGCVDPVAPWLPPLPDALALSTLPPVPPGRAAWGLIDLPAEQRQAPMELDLTEGRTRLIVGTARAGRTTALRSLVLAAAAALPPDRLHLWLVDAGDGLASLDALPHSGGVVPAHDVDRLERLLRQLTDEVGRRRRRGWAGLPLLLLGVDGWEPMLAQAGDVAGGALAETLLRLAADGPAAGLQLILTAARGGLTGRLGAATADRLVLRMSDRSDIALIGVAARDVPRDQPAGRAIRTPDLTTVQIAQPDPSTLARALAWPPGRPPTARRVDPLPDPIPLAAVPASVDPRLLRLGLTVDEHAAVRHDPRDCGSLLVAGPARSGRSTALVLLAHQLGPGPIATLCPRRSPLQDLALPRLVQLPAHDPERALAWLDELSDPGRAVPHLLIDDAELLEDGPLTERLCQLARRARDGHNVVVMAGLTDVLAAAFRGPVAEARRGRAGLLLRPAGPHDGELLGVRLPRRDSRRDPPGRGWWALSGEATAVQLALPPGLSRSPLPAAGSARHAPARPTGPCSVRPASTRTTPGRPR